jgi:predicted transcriptional regulator
MKITFPVELMNQLFDLADQTDTSPAKLTVQAVQYYVDNYDNKGAAISASDKTKSKD